MAAEQGLDVDEDGFRRLMAEQRERAKADAKAKKGKHRDAGAYREVADALGPAGRVHRLRRGGQRGHGPRHRDGRRRRAAASARATRSSSCWTARRSTPRAAASSPTRASSSSTTGARLEVLDVQSPITGLIVHQARVLDGEVAARRRRPGARRRRAAPRDLARPHRDPHGAQGVPRGARRDRDPGRLRERARPVPLRLLRHRGGAGVGDGRRRGAGQRRGPRRPGRPGRGHDPGRGGGLRRDGAVRREVRRPGAGGLGRRLGARALRRHPRRAAPASSA